MKKIVITMLSIVAFSGTAFSAEIINLPAKNGNVAFPHKKHQENLKDCKICHKKVPGKIEGFDKNFAHKLCKGCHEKKKVGPTKCAECHVKPVSGATMQGVKMQGVIIK